MIKEEEVDLTPAQALGLGARLESQGEMKQAEELYRLILEVAPDNYEAMNRLGAVLAARKEFYEALYRFDRAAKLNRKYQPAVSNRGMVLGELGHLDEAIADFHRSLAVDRNNPILWNNLANTLDKMDRQKEAIEAIDQCLKLDPDHAVAYYNKGLFLLREHRYEEAIACLDQSLELDPPVDKAAETRNADIRYNRAGAKLFLGRLKEGFEDYESRLTTSSAEGVSYIGPFDQPKWTGKEDISGKTILVHGEQGAGDMIMFLRYVPMVMALGAKVVMVLHTRLKPTIEHWKDVEVLDPGDDFPPFDYYTPLMSLPYCFGTTFDTIPPPAPLVVPEKDRPWLDKIAGDGLKVGVCWSGNFKHKNDRNRSLELDTFRRIFSVPGIRFFSLQKDVRQMDQEVFNGLKDLVDLGQHFEDFGDTAAAMQKLDLVVSTCTSVTHLSGTMGVPTWILVTRFAPHWTWIEGSDTSPWYPSVRLFRQARSKEWIPVLDRVRSELKRLVMVKQAA